MVEEERTASRGYRRHADISSSFSLLLLLPLSLSLQFLSSTSKFPCKLTFLFIATEFAQNFHEADEVFYLSFADPLNCEKFLSYSFSYG